MAATMVAASCRCASASSQSRPAGRRVQAAFVAAPAQRLASVSSISAASSLAPAAAVRAPRCRAAAAVSVRSEITYVMIKPDGVQRGLVGEIISRFEKKGFKLVQLKMMKVTKEVAEEHYKDLKDKPFFNDLIGYILSGPVVGMVWEGQGVVKAARKLIGATNPLEAEPGTIRGDLSVQTGRNVVHGSDSPENGDRETALWFAGHGTIEWEAHMKPWLVE